MAPERIPSDEEWKNMDTNERLQDVAKGLGSRLSSLKSTPRDEAEQIAEAARRLLLRVDAHDRNQREQE